MSADLTEVDALSGATITSTAVTNIVNNSYFYVTEVLCAERPQRRNGNYGKNRFSDG